MQHTTEALQSAAPGEIGPNAVLQLIPLLDAALDPAETRRLLAAAGMEGPPASQHMMPEGPAVMLHRALRTQYPGHAGEWLRAAGEHTADYILANRIPGFAQTLLRMLPAPVSAILLARAIAQHAWTFCGSGEFRLESYSPVCFELIDNAMVRGEKSGMPACVWHAAVFARLYAALVDPTYACIETACCATGAPACRFELRRGATSTATRADRHQSRSAAVNG
jgi:divinyl protochlorophyllide a 8-vinyl-reductase